MSVWPDWIKVIQLKPRYLFSIWILGVIILFIPSKHATGFGVLAFRESYRQWIGLITLGAFTFWIVPIGIIIFKKIQAKKEMKKNLSGLNFREIELLELCILNKQRTINLELGDPSARSLCHKRIFEQAEPPVFQMSCPFTIPTNVWGYINKKPELIINQKKEKK